MKKIISIKNKLTEEIPLLTHSELLKCKTDKLTLTIQNILKMAILSEDIFPELQDLTPQKAWKVWVEIGGKEFLIKLVNKPYYSDCFEKPSDIEGINLRQSGKHLYWICSHEKENLELESLFTLRLDVELETQASKKRPRVEEEAKSTKTSEIIRIQKGTNITGTQIMEVINYIQWVLGEDTKWILADLSTITEQKKRLPLRILQHLTDTESLYEKQGYFLSRNADCTDHKGVAIKQNQSAYSYSLNLMKTIDLKTLYDTHTESVKRKFKKMACGYLKANAQLSEISLSRLLKYMKNLYKLESIYTLYLEYTKGVIIPKDKAEIFEDLVFMLTVFIVPTNPKDTNYTRLKIASDTIHTAIVYQKQAALTASDMNDISHYSDFIRLCREKTGSEFDKKPTH